MDRDDILSLIRRQAEPDASRQARGQAALECCRRLVAWARRQPAVMDPDLKALVVWAREIVGEE